MLTSVRNTQKLNMTRAPSVASLLGMVTAFGLIPRSTSEIFKIFFAQSFVHSHFVISLPYEFLTDVGILAPGTSI